MKLLCVNAKQITTRRVVGDNRYTHHHHGQGLVEGQTYETNAKPFTDEDGYKNYYIVGLGSRLKCRFAELLDKADKSTEKEESLEDKLEKAEIDEDYDLAIEIREKLKNK